MSSIAPGYLLVILPLAFALAWGLTGRVIPLLQRFNVMDRPNERSSHTIPTPRGGGIGLMLALLPLWAGIALLIGDNGAAVTALYALGLASIGLMDDLANLPILLRLMAQIVIVSLGLDTLPEGSLVFQGLLPQWLDYLLAAFGWLWFINLFNFMDGTDGIAATEAATIGIGVALVILVAGGASISLGLALTMTGAALGFLMWNKSPAKVFMGDVGSVPLGYLLGWLLIDTAVSGYWAAALLLPAYFVFDATITLLRRVLRGETFWQAHRSHYYQQAAKRWQDHARVARLVGALNLILVALGVAVSANTAWTWQALGLGALATIALLFHFADRATQPGSAELG